MLGASYKTKKDLKAAVGQSLRYIETSMFGSEYKEDGSFCVVGPDPYTKRSWYATVVMERGVIKRVS